MAVEPQSLKIKIESTIRLIPDEPAEYTEHYQLTLFDTDEHSDEEITIGLLHVFKVDVAAGNDNDWSLYDLLESHSLDADEFRCAIIDDDTQDVKEEILDFLEIPIISKILILHVCVIHPEHRGHGLGLKLAQKAIEVLGADCSLILCHPSPVESATIENGNVPEGWLSKKGPDVEALRVYWMQLGLKQLTNSKIYGRMN